MMEFANCNNANIKGLSPQLTQAKSLHIIFQIRLLSCINAAPMWDSKWTYKVLNL